MKRGIAIQILAGFILSGFVILAIFGISAFQTSEGDTLLSCLARSAGMVSCDSGGAFQYLHHAHASFEALVNSALVLFVLALAFLPLFVLLERMVRIFGIARIDPVREKPALVRMRHWLSLFESSPGY